MLVLLVLVLLVAGLEFGDDLRQGDGSTRFLRGSNSGEDDRELARESLGFTAVENCDSQVRFLFGGGPWDYNWVFSRFSFNSVC